MREVFKKTKAKCAECGTPLNGTDLLKRGDRYYCPADFERLSPQEKNENRRIKKESDFIKRILS